MNVIQNSSVDKSVMKNIGEDAKENTHAWFFKKSTISRRSSNCDKKKI